MRDDRVFVLRIIVVANPVLVEYLSKRKIAEILWPVLDVVVGILYTFARVESMLNRGLVVHCSDHVAHDCVVCGVS